MGPTNKMTKISRIAEKKLVSWVLPPESTWTTVLSRAAALGGQRKNEPTTLEIPCKMVAITDQQKRHCMILPGQRALAIR